MIPSKAVSIDGAFLAASVLFVRGQRVMLDASLAELYQIETKDLNRAVRRDAERLPPDFMFQLTSKEFEILRCQFGTLRFEHGKHPKYLPLVFTEQGVAMLASVLRTKRAALANIEIVRAFVKLRQILASHAELAKQLAELEGRYDRQFKIVFDAIRKLMASPAPEGRPIGFTADVK